MKSNDEVDTMEDVTDSVHSTNIECFIRLSNDHILSVEVDSKAFGKDVIEKICQRLGIVEESEYFGLQYRGKYNELLWLNLRNRISRQLTQVQPYMLDFRVKYFVQPHTIICEETRHHFYMHAKNRVTDGCWGQDVPMSDIYNAIALMAQIEFGNYHPTTSNMKYVQFWPKTLEEDINSSAIKEVARLHQIMVNWSGPKCEYELLRLISDNWKMYGVSFQDITDCFGKSLKLGVGPEGVYLCTTKFKQIDMYLFASITKINSINSVTEIEMIKDDGNTHIKKFALKSSKAATSFQRYATEINSFFKCETVDIEIIQNCKISQNFFRKANSSFTYDITRTYREVYDSAKRKAFSCSSKTSVSNLDFNGKNENEMKTNSSKTSDEKDVAELRSELVRLQELVQCVVCTDRKINRLFIPCMHIVCCEMCAARLNQCPICRIKIKISHQAFPKWNDENFTNSSRGEPLCTLTEDEKLFDNDQ